jgi:hypothetical protein
VVLVDGLVAGGREGARNALRLFWQKMSAMASHGTFKPSFSDNASSLASKIAQLNSQIYCITAGLYPITSVWCPMSYYRFIARDNASQAAELGGMALENDDMARGFGANVIRDLIREAPSQHAGWILEIARGNRVVAAIPFGD